MLSQMQLVYRYTTVLSPEAKKYYREVQQSEDYDDLLLHAAPSDFFELLGIDYDSDACEAADVKAAFRRLQRVAGRYRL